MLIFHLNPNPNLTPIYPRVRVRVGKITYVCSISSKIFSSELKWGAIGLDSLLSLPDLCLREVHQISNNPLYIFTFTYMRGFWKLWVFNTCYKRSISCMYRYCNFELEKLLFWYLRRLTIIHKSMQKLKFQLFCLFV